MRLIATALTVASLVAAAIPASAQCPSFSPCGPAAGSAEVAWLGPPSSVVVHAAPLEPPPPPPPVDLRLVERRRGLGLGARAAVGFLGGHGIGLTGGGMALRYSFLPAFALELSVDGLVSFDGQDAAIPFGLSAVWFVRPYGRAQPYVFLGVAGTAVAPDGPSSYLYGGIQGGAGLEVVVARWLALGLELRGLVLGDDNVEVPVEAAVVLGCAFHFYL